MLLVLRLSSWLRLRPLWVSPGLGQWLLWLGPGSLMGVPYADMRPVRSVAVASGRSLWSFERSVGVAFEVPCQRLAERFGLLGVCGVLYYVAQFLVVWVALLVLWFLARDGYRLCRDIVFGTTLLSLPVFWLFPVAAPRSVGDSLRSLALSSRVRLPYDAFASFPSLHVACACAVAAGLFVAVPARCRFRWLVWLWPVVVACVVLATGNHYFVDVLAGGFLSVVSVLARPACYWVLSRLRWSPPGGSLVTTNE